MLRKRNTKKALPNNYFQFYITVLKVHGINLAETSNKCMRIFSTIVLLNIPYFYTFQGYYEMALVSGDFQMLLNLGSVLVGQSSAMAQFTIMLFRSSDISSLLDKLQTGYFQFNPNRGGDNELKLIKRALRISNIQVIIYLLGISFLILLGLIEWIPAYINGIHHMPYLPMSIINLNHTPTFELASIYQIYSEITFGVVAAVMDSLTTSILVHIYIQLCILKESITQMRSRLSLKYNKQANLVLSEELQMSKELQLYVRNEFRNIIEHHANIIEFAQQFESIFQLVIFFKFIGGIISLCFLLYHLSLLPVGSIDFNFIGIFYIIIVLQFLMYCWWANQSVITGQEIAIEISKLNWIDKDYAIQKALMMVVRQSQKPLKFTAGKIFMLDLNTFVSVLYSGFSYFTILRRVDEKKDIVE